MIKSPLFCFSPPMLTSTLFFQVYEVSPAPSPPPPAAPAQGRAPSRGTVLMTPRIPSIPLALTPAWAIPAPSWAAQALAASFGVTGKLRTHMEGLNCPGQP